MKRLNTKGFTVVEGLLILVVVGIIGGAGYYVWNQNQSEYTKNSSQNQTGNPSNDSTDKMQGAQEEKSNIEVTTNERVISAGSVDDEARKIGDNVREFYMKVLDNQDSEKICREDDSATICKEYKPYLTEKAIKQLEEPRSYTLLACGQMKIFIYSIDEPVITDSSATVRMRYLQFSQPLQNATEGKLSLSKADDKWLIDSIECYL